MKSKNISSELFFNYSVQDNSTEDFEKKQNYGKNYLFISTMFFTSILNQRLFQNRREPVVYLIGLKGDIGLTILSK